MPTNTTLSGIRMTPSRPAAVPDTARNPLAQWFERIRNWWRGCQTSTRVLCVTALIIAVTGGAVAASWRTAARPMALYPQMTAEDVTALAPRLTAMGVHFTVEGEKIMVAPQERDRVVGSLLAYGFPRYHPPLKDTGASLTPLTDSARREQALNGVRSDLVAQLERFEGVGFANVNLVAADEDATPPTRPRASVLLHLCTAARPQKSQVQAMVMLVTSAVRGLETTDVRVVDTAGHVLYDGQHPTGDDNQNEDEHLGLKRAYEAAYSEKLRSVLDTTVGADNYTVALDVDLDFQQVRIVQTQVGEAGNSAPVVTQKDHATEKYHVVGSDAVQSAGSRPGQYEKVVVKEKSEVGRVERQVVIPPGAVRGISATLVVDGQHSAEDLGTLHDLVGAALGHDATVAVHCFALHRGDAARALVSATPPPVAETAPVDGVRIALVGIPSLLLLTACVMLLARWRDERPRRLSLETAASLPARDVTDLVQQKSGSREDLRETAVSPARFETLARDRPRRVADLLRETWLSERER